MKWGLIILCCLSSCSPSRETGMPFRNFEYGGDRLLPAKTSNAEYYFRIWINNSTSIDRIISISKNSLEDFQGYLTELAILLKGKNTDQEYYRQIKIKPRNGFKAFKNEMDSLDLLNLSSQCDLPEFPLHQPFSIFVVV